MSVPIYSALVAIAASPFSLTSEFYQQLFNQSPKNFQPERYAEFHLPGICLALFSPKPTQAQEFSAPAQSPISLCLKLESLEAAIDEVKMIEQKLRLDCQMGEISHASHGRELYLYDPQGNRIILYQPL